jgi:hypothetical protein
MNIVLHTQLSIYKNIFVFTVSTINYMYVQRAPDFCFASGLQKLRASPVLTMNLTCGPTYHPSLISFPLPPMRGSAC